MRDGKRGCKCDFCGKRLEPVEAIKVKFLKLKESEQDIKFSHSYSVGKMDVCNKCYLRMVQGTLS